MQTQVNYDGGVHVHEEPLVNPNWQSQAYCSHEEFWDMAYADMGKRYGMNDIREAEWCNTIQSNRTVIPQNGVTVFYCHTVTFSPLGDN